MITARQAEVGQVVQATMPIFSLAVDGDRDAVFNVYESLLVAPPGNAEILVRLLDDPKVQARGVIREITPTVSAQSGTVQVKVALKDVPAEMQLGAPVTASTSTGAAEHRAAVVGLDPCTHLPWVVGEGDKVELRKVEVGRTLTGKVVIASGLQAGETVVVNGSQLLHPGMQVEKVDAKRPGVSYDTAAADTVSRHAAGCLRG